jgi:hypothetical protein
MRRAAPWILAGAFAAWSYQGEVVLRLEAQRALLDLGLASAEFELICP